MNRTGRRSDESIRVAIISPCINTSICRTTCAWRLYRSRPSRLLVSPRKDDGSDVVCMLRTKGNCKTGRHGIFDRSGAFSGRFCVKMRCLSLNVCLSADYLPQKLECMLGRLCFSKCSEEALVFHVLPQCPFRTRKCGFANTCRGVVHYRIDDDRAWCEAHGSSAQVTLVQSPTAAGRNLFDGGATCLEISATGNAIALSSSNSIVHFFAR